MYSNWQLALHFLGYYLRASNGKGHGTHSPFIFHFITQLLNDKQSYPAYAIVEELREKMLKNEQVLTIQDFGAGSSISKTNERTVASLAKNAAKPKKFGQLLFRMVKEYQPRTVLELGTSLGITSSYLSLAAPAASLITMEGAPEVAAVARENFQQLGIKNIKTIEGNFDDTLGYVINELGTVDFCFIDGNHRRDPTERYFSELLPRLHNDSIMVFDDIHWSREMEQAWHSIRSHPRVRCSIDLFFIGILFFREEFHEKQDFTIRF